jgi:hypothetical protein
LCVPFHLFPALPDLDVLNEIMELAGHIRLGKVNGRDTVLCLSGSTVILKDVLRVGDVDFCEYISADTPAGDLADSFCRQVVSQDVRYCTVSIRTKAISGDLDELQYWDIKHTKAFTSDQLEAVSELVERGRNVKTAHVAETRFAGVTEVTNWAIRFQAPLERDPISRLSFAHQEAPLGIFARRPLHSLEALVAYIHFLRSEIEKYATVNPVKALKRAIPWLRLFSSDDLRAELIEMAGRHNAIESATALAKLELLKRYEVMDDLRPSLKGMLESLRGEIQRAERLAEGSDQDLGRNAQNRIEIFGHDLAGLIGPWSGKSPLLQRILSLAGK